MTTDKEFADKLIAGDGWLPGTSSSASDNPRCTRIVEYTNMVGVKAYGCTFASDNPDKYMQPSQYIVNPSIYWEYDEYDGLDKLLNGVYELVTIRACLDVAADEVVVAVWLALKAMKENPKLSIAEAIEAGSKAGSKEGATHD